MNEPGPTVVEASGGRVLIALERVPLRALLVARHLQRPPRPFPVCTLRVPIAPSAPGALAVEVGAIPAHYWEMQLVFPPVHPGLALSEPWNEPGTSGIFLPGTVAGDLTVRRNLSTMLLLEPHDLPIPASGSELQRAAQSVLQDAQPETLLRVAMHWAFACDVALRDWDGHDDTLLHHSLSVPLQNAAHVEDAANRLVISQSLRVVAVDAIARDLARTKSGGLRDCYDVAPPLEALVYAYFPSLARGDAPTHAEIRTALWLLAFETPFDDISDSPLASLMAVTFGRQSIGDPHEALDRWLRLVNTPDGHPHGTWTTKDAPSELRRSLRTAEHLDLRDVAILVRDVLPLMILFQDVGNQLWTARALAEVRRGVQDRDFSTAWSFLARKLVRQVHGLDNPRSGVVAEIDLEDSDSNMIARRKAIEQWLIERPFLGFGDGTLIPIGLPDTAYGVIRACETFGDRMEQRDRAPQWVGNLLGLCFQASVVELAHAVQRGHRVLDVDVIDQVMDSVAGKDAKRADLVIGDAQGQYVVIEVTRRNLRGGIRYGDEEALREWADGQLGKLQQVESTEANLDEIASAGGWMRPRQSTGLVVCDLPLPQTLGLRALFDRQSGVHRAPFICSIAEFEVLVAKAQSGWSVPSLVLAWKQSRPDRPLGHFLTQWPHR